MTKSEPPDKLKKMLACATTIHIEIDGKKVSAALLIYAFAEAIEIERERCIKAVEDEDEGFSEPSASFVRNAKRNIIARIKREGTENGTP